MDPLSMSNVPVQTQVAHVAAAVAAVAQMQHDHLPHHQTQQQQQQQQQLSPNNNSHSAIAMEQEGMQENLVNLSDMQEIEEIQEDIEDIVSIPKEVILISLVSQEQALYNPKHEHYRNIQRKDAKWLDIAESVGWSEAQCKAKWKAMRDQYCRELKRSKFNAKANVKWKYFKELDFLRPYALSRNYRPRNSINISNNNNNGINTTILSNNNTTLANVVNNNNNSINNNIKNNQQDNKFPSIKIEAGQFKTEEFVTETPIKTNSRLIATLTDEQLNVMQQQHQQQQQQQQQDDNWSYITTTTTTSTARNSNEMHINSSNGSNNGSNMHATATTTTTAVPSTTAADNALYNSFVAQITQQNNMFVTAAEQMHQQQLQQQQQQQTQMQHGASAVDEEDDDPIHTFLNYENYFEKELITMIQQEDILYNSFHPNYRNVKMKLEVWDEIARKLKKTVKQCRLKWKALRDQYIREHKRLKNRENSESLPRWKHYDALSFLQKFIKHKPCDLEKNLIEIPKTEIDIDMDEPCLQSPTVSPMHVANDLQQHQQQQLQQQLQQALPTLSGPHAVVNSSTQQVQNSLQQQLQQSLQQQQTQLLQHQQQQQQHQHQHQISDEHDESLCGGDVSGYDEMDINDYIIGDADDGAGGAADDEDIDDDDEDIDRKSQQFPVYSPHIDAVAHSNDDHEANDGLQQQHQHIEFKVSHDSSFTQAQTPNSHSLSQQSVALQQHLQQHQQHIIDIDTDDNTEHNQHQQNEQNFAEALQASLLNGGTVTTTATTTAPTAGTTGSNNNESMHVVSVGIAAAGSSSSSHHVVALNDSKPPSLNDDDEVGAFFKAVAMKIRNAKMSPVAFTDLQIDILRVINGTLRNH